MNLSNVSIRALMITAISARPQDGLFWSKDEIAALASRAEAEIKPESLSTQRQLVEEAERFITDAEDKRRYFIMNTIAGMEILRRADPWKYEEARRAKAERAAKIKTAKRYARDHGHRTRFAA